MKTLDAARGHWRTIFLAHGLEPKTLQNRHVDCPICHKKKFRFDDDGVGSWICVCGSGTGFSLLQQLMNCSTAEALKFIDEVIGHKADYAQPKIQSGAQDRLIQFGRELRECGTATARYLKNRGLDLTQLSFMREHPSHAYFDTDENRITGHHPVMVNAFRDLSGRVCAFHRTYLTQDGEKAPVSMPKKFFGKATDGSAIRLSEVHESMGIAEGIETALSIMTFEKMPCWASGSANLLINFIPPDGVRSLTIFADHDRSFTGQAAAYALAKRLSLKGINVEVAVPPIEGDWLDYRRQNR